MDDERVRRFYSVLSRINRLIVRARDPVRLAQEACEVAVVDGQFIMAWVGRRSPASSLVEVYAFAGVGETYLKSIDIDLADPARSRGPTGTAILSSQHVVCNDIESEATMGPWKDEARRHGIRASGAFPIVVAGTVWGALNLYTTETGFFDTDEIRLLDELAMDIGFALGVIEKESQLLQSQKLESVGTLASGLAHDFNNILGVILTQAALLANQTDEVKRRASVAAIQKAGDRGASLVRQLLTFARKSDPRVEPVSLNDHATEVVKLLTATFPKTITLEFVPDPNLPIVEADTTQVHQVLLNLCLNARDAMPGGGRLTLSTGVDRKAWPPQVLLRVTDTGTGMDEDTKRRVFLPFFTTKGADKGTGLGLAMVFGIMETHHGTVVVDSVPGRGTTFECRFPVAGT
jgi:signal transduction histidine kinase